MGLLQNDLQAPAFIKGRWDLFLPVIFIETEPYFMPEFPLIQLEYPKGQK